MRVLLLSTYELGRQPVHVATPAAALRRAGHEVRLADLAVRELGEADLGWAEKVAISVPMHTATRLADGLVQALAKSHPALPIALYGLYAGVGSSEVAARLEGEYEPALLRWVAGAHVGSSRHVGRSDLSTPDRTGLPALDEYARLEHAPLAGSARPSNTPVGRRDTGRTVLAGPVEASHGCRHRCRHCPIPAVYDGRIRVVPRDFVLADITNLVAAGAGHITFGDADFLNAPAHSLAILEAAHAAHPQVTFDATIKVEHILQHDELWPQLAGLNLLFVVSAFESVDDRTLEILDKGHTVADMSRAVALTRDAGIHIRPTWLPFMPWTTPDDVADIFEFIDTHRLSGATDPVQMSIRLLLPEGSLLEDHPAVRPHLDFYDPDALTWRWEFANAETSVLHKELETIAASASDCGQETVVTLNEMRVVVARSTGRKLDPLDDLPVAPRLSESWFCCAEPTGSQAISIRRG
ncbi:MAG TPA: radical SAM protein [Acidimicrobiia bacterium]|nr:radical SAM protein [Acidimicrobiia bacterium]